MAIDCAFVDLTFPGSSLHMLQSEIDALRSVTVPPQQHLIAGTAVESAAGARLDVISPIDGGLLTTIADGEAADIDRAVQAARRVYDGGAWSRAAPGLATKVGLPPLRL